MKMKNLLVAVCCLFISVSAQAQLKIGVKGGANYSQVKETKELSFIDWEALTSYNIGGFAELEMNERLSFRVEALYSFEGGELRNAGNDSKIEVNYLNLPILMRLNLIYGIFIDAGIEPGVIVDGKNAAVDKDTEVGVLLGGGFRLGERLVFNLRYIQGLSNVYNISAMDEVGNTVVNIQGKSTLWQIGAEFYIFK